MAAMVLSLIPLLANARKNGASFPLGHRRDARPHPPPLPQGEGVSPFPQSGLTAGGMDLQAGAERSKAQHRKPQTTTVGSAPG